MDTLIDWPLDRKTLETVTEPRALHRRVMSYLPDLKGRSQAIRADTGTLFRIDLPTDPLGRSRVVSLRVRSDAVSETTGTDVAREPLTSGSRIIAVVAAEKRNTDNKKIRTRPVSDSEVSQWAAALLARNGLRAADDLALSASRRFGPRDQVNFWIRDLSATVSIVDADLAQKALFEGIGRGRSYGLGMIVPITHSSIQPEEDTR